MFRTWSGPGGSSHKDPLVSVLLYSRYLCSVGLRPTDRPTLRPILAAQEALVFATARAKARLGERRASCTRQNRPR